VAAKALAGFWENKMSLLDVIKRPFKKIGSNLENYMGGLLGEDTASMSPEDRRRLRQRAISAFAEGMATMTPVSMTLREAAGEEMARRHKMAQQREMQQRAQAAQQASGQIAGRLLGGAPVPTAPGAMGGDELTGVNVQSQYRRDPMDALRIAMSPAGADAMRVNPLLQAPLQAMLQPQKAEKIYATPNLKDFTRESGQRYLRTGDPTYLISLDEAGTPEARQRALLDRERFRQETGIVLPDLFAIQGGGVGGVGGGGAPGAEAPPAGSPLSELSPQQQREFIEKQLEGETKSVDEALASAQKVVPQLEQVHLTLKTLYEGEPITGLGAQYLKNFERLRSLVSGRPSQEVQDTEFLEALLGRDVFGYIQSLGIGSRGLDTPNEREFLQRVMAGEISMSRETLIQMTEMREKYLRKGLEEMNEKISSGDLDWYYDIKGRFGKKKQPFNVPRYSPPSIQEGQKIRNPSTGEIRVYRNRKWVLQ
jgi:hypothetical protein